MKLKKILFENFENKEKFENLSNGQKDEIFSRLEEIIKSGQWIIKKPYLYRGRDWDGFLKVKDSEKYDKRTPKDTGELMDYIVHDFTVNCFSEYPDRQQSRFALTYPGDATVFGDSVYYIFPYKSSKISHSNIDPYEFFNENGKFNNLEKLIDPFFSNGGRLKSFVKKENFSKEFYNLLNILKKVRNRNFVSVSNSFGCLDKVIEVLENQNVGIEDIENNSKLREMIRQLKLFFQIVEKYFKSLRKGYPKDKESGKGEVVYQGKYVQVHVELWDAYLRKKRSV